MQSCLLYLIKGFRHMGLVDKAMCLLWMVMLETGPSYLAMRRYLNSIRSMTTDQGTEFGLADLPDILPDFIQFLNPKLRCKVVRNT